MIPIIRRPLKESISLLKLQGKNFNLIYIEQFLSRNTNSSVFWNDFQNICTQMRSILDRKSYFVLRCRGQEKYKFKVILDSVFGKDCFKNEIFIKARQKVEYKQNSFIDAVDSLFIYATDQNQKINTIYSKKTATSPSWHGFDSKGQGKAANFSTTESPLYLEPPVGTHWKWKQSSITEALKNYQAVPEEMKTSHSQFFQYAEKYRSLSHSERPRFLRMSKTQRPYYLVYGREEIINTFWDDLETTSTYQGYQVPSRALVKRIVRLLSRKKDNVLLVNFGDPAVLSQVHEIERNCCGIEQRNEWDWSIIKKNPLFSIETKKKREKNR